MGNLFTASSDGNKVIANYNNECTYALSFADEAEAQLFVSELAETQEDYNINGKDNAKRKKATQFFKNLSFAIYGPLPSL